MPSWCRPCGCVTLGDGEDDPWTKNGLLWGVRERSDSKFSTVAPSASDNLALQEEHGHKRENSESCAPSTREDLAIPNEQEFDVKLRQAQPPSVFRQFLQACVRDYNATTSNLRIEFKEGSGAFMYGYLIADREVKLYRIVPLLKLLHSSSVAFFVDEIYSIRTDSSFTEEEKAIFVAQGVKDLSRIAVFEFTTKRQPLVLRFANTRDRDMFYSATEIIRTPTLERLVLRIQMLTRKKLTELSLHDMSSQLIPDTPSTACEDRSPWSGASSSPTDDLSLEARQGLTHQDVATTKGARTGLERTPVALRAVICNPGAATLLDAVQEKKKLSRTALCTLHQYHCSIETTVGEVHSASRKVNDERFRQPLKVASLPRSPLIAELQRKLIQQSSNSSHPHKTSDQATSRERCNKPSVSVEHQQLSSEASGIANPSHPPKPSVKGTSRERCNEPSISVDHQQLSSEASGIVVEKPKGTQCIHPYKKPSDITALPQETTAAVTLSAEADVSLTLPKPCESLGSLFDHISKAYSQDSESEQSDYHSKAVRSPRSPSRIRILARKLGKNQADVLTQADTQRPTVPANSTPSQLKVAFRHAFSHSSNKTVKQGFFRNLFNKRKAS